MISIKHGVTAAATAALALLATAVTSTVGLASTAGRITRPSAHGPPRRRGC